MTSYNRKVNIDGTYRPFHGYTVVAMADGNFTAIEKYIQNNEVLCKYFSPLPSSSYHMTIFNIWCNGQRLLPMQKQALIELRQWQMREAYRTKYDRWPYKMPKGVVWDRDFYDNAATPCGFIDEGLFVDLMGKIRKVCNLKGYRMRVEAHSTFHGLGTSLIFGDKETQDAYEKQRSLFRPLVGHDDKKLRPHMTFAYRYRDIPLVERERVQKELDGLNFFVKEHTKNGIRFSAPRPYWFTDMTNYLTDEEMYE